MAEVEGLQELLRALDNTSLNLGGKRKLIVKSLRAGGQPILEAQKAAAPDDPETAESRIEENLGISVVEQTSEGAELRVGTKKWGFIGRFAEHGTMNQPRRAWMGPSFDNTEEQAVEIIAKVLGDGIEDAFNE